MNKILNQINMRNIQELYEIKGVGSNGQISTKNKSITVYKIDPANIIACSEEVKIRIYQAYLTCVRGLPKTFQIIISREKASFAKQIKEYKERLLIIENQGLKFALQKYIEYLEQIEGINKLYKTSHFLVVENLDEKDKQEIVNIFSNLREFGVKITRIESQEKITTILRNCIMKEENKWS